MSLKLATQGIAQNTQVNDRSVLYNFRYFLPHAPLWGDLEHCRLRLKELLQFCEGAKVDMVQFFVNTLPGTYYMPPSSAEEQAEWAAWMKNEVAPSIRKAGISYQLNFQMLLGGQTYQTDMRPDYSWGFLVDEHGKEALGCACPLCPTFKKSMGKMLNLWASTKPEVIWIDDDFRMHNHGLANPNLEFYCYCERHLAAFSKREGRTYTRETLLSEVLKAGHPTALRGKWLDFLGDCMVESAEWIRAEIQGVSPETRIGLMTSAPDVHAAEGRDWNRIMKALSGKFRPLTRPCSGCYTGTTVPPKYQSISYRFMAQSMDVLEQALGVGVTEYGPELENTRFTTWSKSSANSCFVLELGQLLGAREITLSTHDLEGSPLSEEPTIEPLLRNSKPRLQAISDLDLAKWMPQGVVFLNDLRSGYKVSLPKNAKTLDLGLLREWEDILLQFGVPAYYTSPRLASEGNEVVVLERFTAWLPSDEELTKILKGSVLLDGGAADVLQERGFGKYLGVKVGSKVGFGATSEIYEKGLLPGVDVVRIPHRGNNWYEMEAQGAQVTSRFIDSRNSRYVASTIFKNEMGGRVCIYSNVGDSMGGAFASHARLRWLHGALRWLSEERFSLLPLIPHHGLSLVRSNKNEHLIAFASFGTDLLEEFKFRTGLKLLPKTAQVLNSTGEWESIELEEREGVWRVPCQINIFNWLILKVKGIN